MSQQYFYNNPSQFTTNPTTYASQNPSGYTATAVAPPLTSGYSAAHQSTGYNVSSAHRSSAPVTYTYPNNTTVVPQPVAVVPAQQATIVASQHPNSGKVGTPAGSYIITNGPAAATTNNNAYAVTTSYFQQLPAAQNQMQHHQSMALAAAHHAVVAAAARGRRKQFTGRGGGETQTFYCDVCKVSCAGPQTYKEHLDGQKHKKKASGSKVPQGNITRSNQRQLRCELCDVTCTGVDAYQAHVRGTKHQKTLKLHQRLGKPIPSSDPVVVKQGNETTVETTSNIVIAAAPKIKFINKVVKPDGSIEYGPLESSTASTDPVAEEHVDINTLQEKNVPPVGGEYIETTKNECGKVVQFFCKLCSCKFNDPHAKEMHLKGRRHRLQYKKKVDPSLIVDVKVANPRNWKLQEDKMRQKQQREESWRRRDMQSRMREMQSLEYSNMVNSGYHGYSQPGMRSFDTLDDKHVLAKHTGIIPSDKDLQNTISVVCGIEKSLKQLSEIIMEDIPESENKEAVAEEDKPKEPVKEKSLSGAMRVGALAKNLLLRGDLNVTLVLLCTKWPTLHLINKIIEKLPDKLNENLPNELLDVTVNDVEQCLIVKRNAEPTINCKIQLTSSFVREEGADNSIVQPEDGLDRKRCLEALASLRHTKWFQAKVTGVQPCVILVRLLRELCRRVPTWNPMSDWIIQLLVEKIVSSETVKLSPGYALRRFFECLASGLLLNGGPGVKDPCEKDLVDASGCLSDQEREDITASAQHALRLIAFRQIHKVLGMDALNLKEDDKQQTNQRKRRHSEEEAAAANSQKKDKREPIKTDPTVVPADVNEKI